MVLAGSDTRQLVAVKYHPADRPAFHLLKGAEAQQWTKRVETNVPPTVYEAEEKRPIEVMPKRFKPMHFGPGDRFTLVEDKTKSSASDKRLAVR